MLGHWVKANPSFHDSIIPSLGLTFHSWRNSQNCPQNLDPETDVMHSWPLFQHSTIPCTRHKTSAVKPRLCSSLLLRFENPCCNACFPILFLDIFINIPRSQNRSNCASRYGFLRLATDSTAQSGLKATWCQYIIKTPRHKISNVHACWHLLSLLKL